MLTKIHSSRNWQITSNNGDLKRKCLLFKLGQFTSNYSAPAFAVYFNGALILFNNIHIQRISTMAKRPVFSSMEPTLPVLPLQAFHPLPTPVFLLLLLLRIQNLPVFLLMNKMTYVERVQSTYQRPKMTFFLSWTSLLSFIQETCSNFTSESMNSEISHPRMKTTQ